MLELAGHDAQTAPDWVWVGALRVTDLIDDIRYLRTLMQNTAKASQKAARGSKR